MFLCICSQALADSSSSTPPLVITEENGTNAGRYRTLKVPNGTTTNNGDGSVTFNGGSGSPSNGGLLIESSGGFLKIESSGGYLQIQ